MNAKIDTDNYLYPLDSIHFTMQYAAIIGLDLMSYAPHRCSQSNCRSGGAGFPYLSLYTLGAHPNNIIQST